MKTKILFFLFLFHFIPSAHSQPWIGKWISKTYPDGLSNTDSLISLLKLEFTKARGTTAPNFAFTDIETDKALNLRAYQGNVVLVNLWATNCSGCRFEVPDLSKLQAKYYDQGLRVIFLSSEQKEKLTDYYSKNTVSGVKGIIQRNELVQPYQMFAMPSSFLIDREGIVRDTWIGPEKYEILKDKVVPLLQSAK
jgi:peroxiredoxin